MRDFVKEMMEVWNDIGPEAAFVRGAELLREIETEFDRLRNQASLIDALGAYLRDTAELEIPDSNRPPRLQAGEISERHKLIVEAALALWRRLPPGNNLIRVEQVVQELARQGIKLDVQQPHAVVGTVLARADGFNKISRSVFEYRQANDDRSY